MEIKNNKYINENDIISFLKEDGLFIDNNYQNSIPSDIVMCHLKIKTPLILAGLPWFISVFKLLSEDDKCIDYKLFEEYEGKEISDTSIIFKLPFNVALTGERVALNLLQRASSVATYTSLFVNKAKNYGIKILDTRKTTPGLRSLEKYAVLTGGGHNHRFTQVDMFMIKDNHKSYFGGLKQALSFFLTIDRNRSIMVEVHNIEELKEAISLNIHHIMLDNFSVDLIKKSISIKPDNIFYEVSGGITLSNLSDYLIEGIDALSVGRITSYPTPVDISLKIL